MASTPSKVPPGPFGVVWNKRKEQFEVWQGLLSTPEVFSEKNTMQDAIEVASWLEAHAAYCRQELEQEGGECLGFVEHPEYGVSHQHQIASCRHCGNKHVYDLLVVPATDGAPMEEYTPAPLTPAHSN